MSHEVEVKLRADSFDAVRRALRAAGAEHLATVIQADTYYDTPDRMFLRRDCGLRIRRTRLLRAGRARPDTRPLLTAKGPGHAGRGAKVRRELQTHVDDAEPLEELLLAAGFVPTLTVEKRRATYRLAPCLIELDELPVIGRFIEIEGPDENAIRRACRRLGLDGEPITDHYINLLWRAAGGHAAGARFALPGQGGAPARGRRRP